MEIEREDIKIASNEFLKQTFLFIFQISEFKNVKN